jgi:drug/metabolite transporter (DMT)-like permease
MQMLVGGVFMIAIGFALGEAGRFDPRAVSVTSAAALLYLIAVAVVALPSYNWLLTVTSPALVGTYAFVNPVVAVLLGYAVANETLTDRTGIAAALVVFGVMLLVWPRKPNAEPTEDAKEDAGTEADPAVGSRVGEPK